MQRSVTFIRHGNAAARADGSDLDRRLTPKGHSQAWDRACSLPHRHFDMVCSSLASRAMGTAEIISGWDYSHIRKIPDMYPDPKVGDGMLIDRMFTQLGYAPLCDYLAHPHANAIRAHGVQVWRQLQRRMVRARSTLIAGHAILLPATAWAACAPHEKFIDELMSCNLGEAEGFTIGFDDWKPVGFIPRT